MGELAGYLFNTHTASMPLALTSLFPKFQPPTHGHPLLPDMLAFYMQIQHILTGPSTPKLPLRLLTLLQGSWWDKARAKKARASFHSCWGHQGENR